MKRAASFGRAPVMTDIDDRLRRCSATTARSIPRSCSGARTRCTARSHEYEARRAIVDTVPDAVLRMPPQVAALLIEFRSQLQQSVDHDA